MNMNLSIPPTIDPKKCVKCGKNVYEWTENGSTVARPYYCVVGSSTCTKEQRLKGMKDKKMPLNL